MSKHFLQLKNLLGKTGFKNVLLMLPVMTIAACLEVANMSVLIPFLRLVSDTNNVLQYPFAKVVYHYFNFESPTQFIVFAGIVSLSTLLISNIFNSWSTWRILSFGWEQNHQISFKLFAGYLQQPFSYFLHKNSSDISKNLLTEVQQFTQNFLIPFMMVLSRIVIIIAIISLLIIYNPIFSSCIILILFFCYGTIYTLFRKNLLTYGKIRLQANKDRFRIINEAMGGIKEIKILNLEDYYKKLFLQPSLIFSRDVARSHTIATLPRYFMETVAFGSLITIILYFLKSGGNAQNILPIIGLYTFAGYRLMPALQVFYSNFTLIRNNTPSLDLLYKEHIKLQTQTDLKKLTLSEEPIIFNKNINVKKLSYRYTEDSPWVLEDIEIKIPAHTSLGIVGETGSGKTTFVDLILGLLSPTKGHICIDDTILSNNNKKSWQNQIGYVPQFIYLSDSSIAQNIAFGIPPDQINMELVKKAAQMAHAHQFISECPQGYETIIGERGIRLSGGQRQRIGIARALYRQPKVLVLDEATSALDIETEQAVVEAINFLANSVTLIVIAHRISTLKECQIILDLNKKKKPK